MLKAKQVKELQGLVGVLQSRNQSLLIHGLSVPTVRQLDQLCQLVRDLLGALRDGLDLELDMEPIPLGRP